MSEEAKKPGSIGIPGILKGLATTARTMAKPTHTAEYPDAQPRPGDPQPDDHDGDAEALEQGPEPPELVTREAVPAPEVEDGEEQ